jgi:TonB-linked SusC/RagA family outer membrane protein
MRSKSSSMLGFAFALVALAAPAASAQNGRVEGTVTDSLSRQPVEGVQVVLTGTAFGAVTGSNGRYVLANVAPGTYELEARRIGYAPLQRAGVQVPAGGTVTLDLQLNPRSFRMQDVVVTGVVDPTAGVKVPFTVGKVDAADAPVPAMNALETIAGKVAGVSVIGGGQPGAGTSIVLRTPSSISKGNAPLVVVDGVILSQGPGTSSADIGELDIESIEVVKGAAAASLYGSRAANGVIQIRTQRGGNLSDGRTRVNVRSEVGSAEIAHKVEWARYHFYRVNADGEYVDASGAVTDRTGRVDEPVATRFQDNPYPDPIYSQVDRFFDPGQTYTNSISIAQNAGSTNWLASLSNRRDDGVVLDGGGYSKNDVRLNLDHRLRDNLSVAFSAYYMRSKRDNLYGDTFFDLIFQPPDVDLRAPDPDGTSYIFLPEPRVGEENPLYVNANQLDVTRRARALGSADLRFSPLSWLTLDGNVSYDRSDRTTSFFRDRGVKIEGQPLGANGEVSEANGTTDALNASASANLMYRFDRLTARSTVRALMERQDSDTSYVGGEDLAVSGVPDLNNVRAPFAPRSSVTAVRSNGYFGTLGLDFAGKYIADALVRRDGSSLFGADERWHTYYRVSGAYRMAEEPWWPVRQISEFKLRASRGTAGGRPDFSDQYETYDLLTSGGIEKSTRGNPDLKPELETENEFGLDMIAFERLSAQLTYARSTVVDQIILVPLEAFYGFRSQWLNAGTVKGNTWEATLEAQVISTPTTSWRVGLVADRSRHKVTEFDRGCFVTQTIGYRCAGESLSAMYANKWITSFDELPEIHRQNGSLGFFARNDDGLIVPVGPDGRLINPEWGRSLTIDGRTYNWGRPIALLDSTGSPAVVKVGDGNPDYRLGLSSNLTWRGLQLYALVDIQKGGNVYNRTKQRMYQYQRSRDVDQDGKPLARKKPIEYYSDLYAANNANSWFVEDAGYLKLREVSIRYRLGESLVRRVDGFGVRGVSLALIGRNLYTKTDYSGYDPDVGSNADGAPSSINRLDDFIYPQYRSFTGSVEIEF